MCGYIEFGICQICGKPTNLERTYFEYGVKCDCHSPNYFELVIHCKDCAPVIPITTRYSKDGKIQVLVDVKPNYIRGKYKEHNDSEEIKEDYGYRKD